jgi:hypothetical protein
MFATDVTRFAFPEIVQKSSVPHIDAACRPPSIASAPVDQEKREMADLAHAFAKKWHRGGPGADRLPGLSQGAVDADVPRDLRGDQAGARPKRRHRTRPLWHWRGDTDLRSESRSIMKK